MLPEQFEDVERDKTQTITNCTIIHYSRRNPDQADDVRDKLSWRRIVNPAAIETSPVGGEWLELPPRPKYTGAELLRQAERAPRLILHE
jgi:hypothetical protein